MCLAPFLAYTQIGVSPTNFGAWQINPALAKYSSGYQTQLAFQNSNSSISNSPSVIHSLHRYKFKAKSLVVGTDLQIAKVGITQQTLFNIPVIYSLKVSDEISTTAYLSLGGKFETINFSKSITAENNDPLINQYTPNSGQFYYQLGGALLYKTLRVGMSYHNLSLFNNLPQFNVNLKHTHILNEQLSIISDAFLGFNPNDVMYQISPSLIYKQQIQFGVSLQTEQSFGLFAAYNVTEQFKLQYQFNSASSAWLGAAHFIGVQFQLQ